MSDNEKVEAGAGVKDAPQVEEAAVDETTDEAKAAAEAAAAEEARIVLKNAKVLTKEDILAADDVMYEEVYVEEWKGKVRIKILSGVQRDAFENKCVSQTKGKKIDLTNLRVTLITMAIVNADNTLMFTRQEAIRLNGKNGKVIEALYNATRKLNGIGDDNKKDLAKNSEADQND